MKLEVGEFYLSAGGEIVKIDNHRENDLFPFLSTSGSIYMQDGSYFEDEEDKQDLIAHIPKELHYHICQMITTYHTQPNYAEKVNEVFEVFNKKRVIPD